MSLITIVYEEPHFMVCDKPAGLLTQAAPGVPSLEVILQKQLQQRDATTTNPFIGMAHRLDRGTSGVIVVARNQRALKRLNEQFHSRKINKYYVAVVEGELPPGIHQWEDLVRKITDVPKAEIVQPGVEVSEGAIAKEARMAIVSLAYEAPYSLALVRLETGRMHQIRLQAASRGFPIAGDKLYGSQQDIDWLQPSIELSEHLAGIDSSDPVRISNTVRSNESFALHALRIEIRHPQNGKQIGFTAPTPATWQHFSPAITTKLASLIARSTKESDVAWELEVFI